MSRVNVNKSKLNPTGTYLIPEYFNEELKVINKEVRDERLKKHKLKVIENYILENRWILEYLSNRLSIFLQKDDGAYYYNYMDKEEVNIKHEIRQAGGLLQYFKNQLQHRADEYKRKKPKDLTDCDPDILDFLKGIRKIIHKVENVYGKKSERKEIEYTEERIQQLERCKNEFSLFSYSSIDEVKMGEMINANDIHDIIGLLTAWGLQKENTQEKQNKIICDNFTHKGSKLVPTTVHSYRSRRVPYHTEFKKIYLDRT